MTWQGPVYYLQRASGRVTSGFVGNSAILSGNIGSGQIASGHLASGLIANLAATLTSGSVQSGHIGSPAVFSGNIGSGQIGLFHLQSGLQLSGSIMSGGLGSGQVGVHHLQSGLTTSGLYLSGSIGSGQVGFGHLANASVQSGTITAAIISTPHMASGAVRSGIIGITGTPDGTQFFRDDFSWQVPAGSAGANPAASVGLTAVNGVAATFLRSDGAPPIDQAIVPTWTALHTFKRDAIGTASTPEVVLTNTTAAALGAQQVSPAIVFTGRGWQTGVDVSHTYDWMLHNHPIQSSVESSYLYILKQIDGGGYTVVASFGMAAGVEFSVTGTISANEFAGGGAGLTDLTGSEVTGTVPSATLAATATALATPRAINGINFDGTAAITVTTIDNLLINGGFDFAQRQTPATLTTLGTTDVYSADRWKVAWQNASVQYQRTDSVGVSETGITAERYGTFKQITNTGKFIVYQIIEGVNSQPMQGRTVTFQCKMKSSTTTTMRMAILELGSGGTQDTIPSPINSAFGADTTDPTWGANVTALGTASKSVTTAWTLFSVTGTITATTKNVMVAVWTNSGVVADVTVSITEAQLVDGSNTQPWLPRPTQQELALCKRYYEKSFGVDVAPAQTTGDFTGALGVFSQTASVVDGMTAQFSVEKRAIPTIVTYNPSSAVSNANWRNNGDTVDAVHTTVRTGRTGFVAQHAGAAVALWLVHWSASAEL